MPRGTSYQQTRSKTSPGFLPSVELFLMKKRKKKKLETNRVPKLNYNVMKSPSVCRDMFESPIEMLNN